MSDRRANFPCRQLNSEKIKGAAFCYLRADVSNYRPEVYKSEKSKILQKIRKVALGKLLT